MKTEKHCSVIDAEGRHVTYVLVKIRDKPLEDGGTEQVEEVQNYTLKVGEQLVDAQPPVMRQHAGSVGYIAPVWGGSDWQEIATADEIAAWEKEHPAPEIKPAPMTNAELEAENKLLKAQIAAQSDRADFVEDCIAEMAMQVYITNHMIKFLERMFLMMAMFFAQRVILGKTEFDAVPKALKKQVAEILIDSGLPEMVPAEFGSTKE